MAKKAVVLTNDEKYEKAKKLEESIACLISEGNNPCNE